MDFPIIYYFLILLIAFLYACVGHGGASGYLALMAIYEMSPEIMKPSALILNLFVSGIAFVQFYRANFFNVAIFMPLAVSSIPLAFLGGMTDLDAAVYKKILGILLLIPVIRFLFFTQQEIERTTNPDSKILILLGGLIGYISGLIGIGGGILLSPVLLLLKWTDQKQTAAISAIFIFVNSLSGLAGQITQGIQFDKNIYLYIFIAVAGGAWGAFFGAAFFKQHILKNILAVVLLVAVYKLLFSGV